MIVGRRRRVENDRDAMAITTGERCVENGWEGKWFARGGNSNRQCLGEGCRDDRTQY